MNRRESKWKRILTRRGKSRSSKLQVTRKIARTISKRNKKSNNNNNKILVEKPHSKSKPIRTKSTCTYLNLTKLTSTKNNCRNSWAPLLRPSLNNTSSNSNINNPSKANMASLAILAGTTVRVQLRAIIAIKRRTLINSSRLQIQ